MTGELPETEDYSGVAVLVSALVGLGVAFVSVWWAIGFGPFFEELFRIGPTVEGGGVGSDWVAGNTIASLDFLIAFIHAADVIMGLFILLVFFIHWAAFRRLAGQMRQPGEQPVTDGGQPDGGDEE